MNTPRKRLNTRARILVGAGTIVALATPVAVWEWTRPACEECPEAVVCPEPVACEVCEVEPEPSGMLLFEEGFDDADLPSRGFYDNPNVRVLDGALRFTFEAGASLPTSGGSLRRQFEPAEAVRLSYRVRYAEGWAGSGMGFGPHEWMILSTESTRYANPSRTALTIYVEQNAGAPRVITQDSLNIDSAQGPVSGCAPLIGSADALVSCYGVGAARNNVRWWAADSAPLTVGAWHTVVAEVRLNSPGILDGSFRVEVDGREVLAAADVMFRTTAYPSMRLSQLMIGPYISSPGSPVAQSFEIDDIRLEALP